MNGLTIVYGSGKFGTDLTPQNRVMVSCLLLLSGNVIWLVVLLLQVDHHLPPVRQ